MKIVWLCPYPIINFKEKINFLRIGKYHPASWIVNLSNYLSTIDEINLHIVTESGNIKKDIYFTHNNIEFHILKNSIPLFNRSYPWFFPYDMFNKYKFIINKYVNKIVEINPDIVHAHGTENSYALAGIKSGYPLLVSIQGIIQELYKTNPNLYYYLLKKTEYMAVKSAKYFACRTSFDKNFVKEINPEARIFTLYEALNPIYLKDNWKINNSNNILFLSFLIKRKGIEDLIKTVAILKEKYKDILLNVVGDGTEKYKKYLMSLISKYNIENNVIFHGPKKANEIINYFETNQIYILPTYNDNSPNSLAEAMSSGMPVISTTVGGIKDMITNKENGYLYNAGDIEALVKLIDFLLQNKNERVRIGKNASNLRVKHTSENVCTQTLNAYNTILSKEND